MDQAERFCLQARLTNGVSQHHQVHEVFRQKSVDADGAVLQPDSMSRNLSWTGASSLEMGEQESHSANSKSDERADLLKYEGLHQYRLRRSAISVVLEERTQGHGGVFGGSRLVVEMKEMVAGPRTHACRSSREHQCYATVSWLADLSSNHGRQMVMVDLALGEVACGDHHHCRVGPKARLRLVFSLSCCMPR